MVIAPSPYPDGTYKRTAPKIVFTTIITLSRDELKARRRGYRGCSCRGDKLTDIARYCVSMANEHNSKSWSIYPVTGKDEVYVEFHSWPQMGLCNYDQPVVRSKNYWWDDRPQPMWMTGDEYGEEDMDGQFDTEA